MLSTELPVTEWWDPEYELYAVQPFPDDSVPFALWHEAYLHEATIEWIMTGHTWGWPDGLFARQLEPPRRPPSWYPGQPEPQKPRRRACTCFYGLRQVLDAPGPYVVSPTPSGEGDLTWWTRCFVIVFDCPHHGDDNIVDNLDPWDHEPQYWP
jgi:hypothetical protein